MKYVLFFMMFFVFINTNAEFKLTDNCSYKSKFDECNNSTNSLDITDFICNKTLDKQGVLLQIIFDEKAKVIDKQLEKYLKDLEDNKNYYFGPDSKETQINAIDDIEKIFGEKGYYGKNYSSLCQLSGEVIAQGSSCVDGGLSTSSVDNFIQNCNKLNIEKINVSKQVAYNLLMLNKVQVMKDSKKEFTQKQRTKYDNLLEIMFINAGYMEKIWKKWPSKTTK